MSQLGVNVDGRGGVPPAAIAALGATWARCVALPDVDLSAWLQGCHAWGIKVLLVYARESLDNSWDYWLATYRDRYGSLVDAHQPGNEPDHDSPSSWTMSPYGLNLLLKLAREQLGPGATIVGPGLVSGQPQWAAQIDWSPVDAIAVHPYAKQPDTPELANLLAAYRGYGKPLWISEYHARTRGMAAYLRDAPGVEVALAFAYSDSMVQGFGLIEDPGAVADFKAAAGGPLPAPVPPTKPPDSPPATPQPTFQLGFGEWAALEPGLMGAPLEDEQGFAPGVSLQACENGVLFWVDERRRVKGRYAAGVDLAEVYGFRAHDGRRYQWRRGWPASRVVS